MRRLCVLNRIGYGFGRVGWLCVPWAVHEEGCVFLQLELYGSCSRQKGRSSGNGRLRYRPKGSGHSRRHGTDCIKTLAPILTAGDFWHSPP